MPKDMSPSRKRLFWAIIVLIIILVPLIAFEVGLRLVGVRVSDDPYLQFGPVQSVFVSQTINGREYYHMADRKLYRERNLTFPVHKDPGTFRVFCLGASASAGWPHPKEEIYSAYLGEALKRAYPDKKIEVINISAHSYPAYRVRLIAKEALNLDPNLLIIWSGNAEFIEPRIYTKHWFDPALGLLNRSTLYRVLRGTPLARKWVSDNTLPADYVRWQRGTMLAQVPPETRTDPVQLKRVEEHYAYSIDSIVKSAQEQGVPVILLTVPVNLRDWHPNVSHQTLKGEELARWQEHYYRGRAALIKNELDTALSELKLAASLAPEHADAYYFLGRALERSGQFTEAIAAYSRARDLDYYPSRAISNFNVTVRKVASQNDGVELADAEAAFWADSAPRAPGFELFLDYVHPSMRGNLIAAKTVFDTIAKHKMVEGASPVAEFSHEPRPYHCGEEKRHSIAATGCPATVGLYGDNTDFPMQVLLVKLFAQMNQNENLATKLDDLERAPGIEALDEMSKALLADARSVYRRLVDLERRRLLGEPVDADAGMKVAEDDLEKFQLKYYGGYRELQKKVTQQKGGN